MTWPTIEQLLQWAAIATAGLSGWLWFRASQLRLPPVTYEGLGENGPFVVALKRQSALNGYAAFAATFSAFFQSTLMLVGLLRH